MNATLKDVARAAGVSPMTVSRVVNAHPRVSAETRRRVEAAIVELSYVPNRLARGLIRQKTGTLGLIVPDVANPFFTLVVRGAEQVAWRSGYHVMLCNTQGDLDRERGYLEDMVSFAVEGLLVAPVGDESRANLRMLERKKLPFVLVDRSVSGFKCDVVQGDSVGGARIVVDHLLALGHRRIAIITGRPTISTARDRLLGYREALATAGIPIDEALVAETSAADPHAAREVALTLLEVDAPPTAIFAFNNITAVGVVQAARERSLDIPTDLALVCFDDIEYLSELYPFLTVMAQPAETFGTVATQLLLERLTETAPQRARSAILPAQLIVRRSCGAAVTGQAAASRSETVLR